MQPNSLAVQNKNNLPKGGACGQRGNPVPMS